MDYISVKEAAVKFNLSERRVQKLCETDRIKGCTMISGVWLIPSTASKPSDKRLQETQIPQGFLTLKELSEKLSVSYATARNWLKLGKITPDNPDCEIPFFSEKYVSDLRFELQTGINAALKSRRNKKFMSGNSLYNSYVSEHCRNLSEIQKLICTLSSKRINLDISTVQMLVADCALHLFVQKLRIDISEKRNLLHQFLEKKFSIGKYDALMADIIPDNAMDFCRKNQDLFDVDYVYEPEEDILGLIYISCKNMGKRKLTGSYYTPTAVVKKLIGKIDFGPSKTLLDPCCGTGNFLMHLPDSITFDQIYGNDIDDISAKITRLNMALKYGASVETIYSHITSLDYLTDYEASGFEYIIGNPPWGYEFSEEEKQAFRHKFNSAGGNSIESYDLFIEKAIGKLSDNGHLAFVLPEAILNVKAHSEIRKLILKSCSIKNLDFLGNAFDGVHCPSIILDLECTHSELSTAGMKICTKTKTFTINTERTVNHDHFTFTATDEEYETLDKIKNMDNAAFLAGNADFALGIVTGNNKKYISDVKTDENEMLLKGTDISKFHITPSGHYITFKPEAFQQSAPIEFYRAPEKLLYRFISNRLIFAYDDRQTLSLNSCNIVIPRIPGIKMKYVLAILNSTVAQFIYKYEFSSIKVLRSHIESIPIPMADEATQKDVISLTDKLISGLDPKDAEETYAKLDLLISKTFGLNTKEIKIIKNAVGHP